MHNRGRSFGFRLFLSAVVSSVVSGAALAFETDLEIVAVEARKAGVKCFNPKKTVHLKEKSSVNRAVWRLDCENASYEVVIFPEKRPLAIEFPKK